MDASDAADAAPPDAPLRAPVPPAPLQGSVVKEPSLLPAITATATIVAASPLQADDVEFVDDDEDLPLPPLPRPRRAALRAESCIGIKTILAIIGVVLIITHLAILPGSLSAASRTACLAVTYAEVSIALLCLERILRGDPGTIKRTPATTRPVPRRVADALRRYPTADAVAHHCSQCQRCVVDFDHHCGFYGRCIAGGRTSGSVPFFFAIIATGYAAFFSTLVFLVLALSSFDDPG
ncbi:protein-cysteine S-palmitoyltransferase [Aureococcus anophagefferens]|nr:protein-cysteine S-palmitoyltransferase [Aureococcus anophagefferens]